MRSRTDTPLLTVAGLLLAVAATSEAVTRESPPRVEKWTAVELPGRLVSDGRDPIWLRAWVRVPVSWTGGGRGDLWAESVTVTIEGLPGEHEVRVNGTVVGTGGSSPPVVQATAEGQHRYKVPPGTLANGLWNALVIRVHAPGAEVHASGPVPSIQGYFLECLLEGEWEVALEPPGPRDEEPRKERPARATHSEFREASRILAEPIVDMPGRRVPARESLRRFEVDEDLAVDLMLSEPVVAQPTHLSFDARGRLWVAQYRQYPYPAGVRMVSRDKYYRSRYDRIPPPPHAGQGGRDRITVHEDTDGDGKLDRHRVVLDGLNLAIAALTGHGGLWVLQPPYLLFYPENDGEAGRDEAAYGDHEVRLAGFGIEDSHSVANGLVWGPDGWLYGAQGSTVACRVVRPGIDPPGAAGVYHEGCMVWRYHPGRRDFEIFARGGGNVFSLEFDDDGRLFSGHNGGDTRGWHYVQGGYHLKQERRPGKYGPPAHPYAFGDLPKMAAGRIARFTHTLVVADGRALPRRMHGRLVAADPLRRRLVLSERERRGATWRTHDAGFPLESDDPTFRPVFLARGADGALWIADFCEEFIAHGQHYQGQIDRSSGRVWRLRSRSTTPTFPGDLSRMDTSELIALFEHPDRWRRHTAVRILAERRATDAVPELLGWVRGHDGRAALEALWTLAQLDALDVTLASELLEHPHAPVRAWTVRLLGDRRRLPDAFLARLIEHLPHESDVEVAAQVASTAQRLDAVQSLPLVRLLGLRDADADDPYLPLLVWWALERSCEEHREEVLALFEEPAFWTAPLVERALLERVMRRFAATGRHDDLLACARLLELAPGVRHSDLLLSGFEKAFQGRSLDGLPRELTDILARQQKLSLVLRMRAGEDSALLEAMAEIRDPRGETRRRELLARVLGEVAPPATLVRLLDVLQAVLTDANDVNDDVLCAILTALQRVERPEVAERVLEAYPGLPPAARMAGLGLLASRPSWASRLLVAVEKGLVERDSIPAEIVIALRLHPGGDLRERVARALGEPPAPTGEAAVEEMARIREVLRKGPGRPYRGEPIFERLCASCHRLFHKGRDLAPDLTSYQREDLNALLLAIADPGSEIREGFEGAVAILRDGRQLVGRTVHRDPQVVVLLATDGSRHNLRREDLLSLLPAGKSLMPEGLLAGLSDRELRDLFAYLRIAQPISE